MATPIPPLVVLGEALPAILYISIFIVAWIIAYRFALQRQSRGLLLISRGFLAKMIIDGAWDTYYYGLLGGAIGIFNSSESQSGVNIAQALGLYFLIGLITSTVSLVLMVSFIIYGALKMTSERQVIPDQAATPTLQ